MTTHICINGQPTDLPVLINSTGVGVVVIPVVAAGVILAGLGAVPPSLVLPIPAEPPGQPSPDTGDSSNDDPDDDEPPHPDPEPSPTRSMPPQTGNVLMSSSSSLNDARSSPTIGVPPSSGLQSFSGSLQNSMTTIASATNSANASYITFENLLEPELGGDEKDPRIAGIASEMEERIRSRKGSRCASNQTQSELLPSMAATQTESNAGSSSNPPQTATASPSVRMQAQPSSYIACGQYTTDASECPPECPFAAFGGVDTGVANEPGFSTGICSAASSSSSTTGQNNVSLDKSKSLTYSPAPKLDYFTPQVLSIFTIKDPETPGKEGTCSALFVGTQLTVGQPCMPRTFSFQILSRTSDAGSNTYKMTWQLDHTVQYFGAIRPPRGLETVVVKSLKIDVTCHSQDCSQIGQTAESSTRSNAPPGFSGDQVNAKRKRSRFDDQPLFVT